MEYGIQLYSVKDFMAKDVKGTLRELAAMGYTMVEPAGFFDVSAEDFRAYCDEFGLRVSGSHSQIKELEGENFEKTVSYFKTIGCKRFIVPGIPTSTTDRIDDAVEKFNRYAPLLKAAGIELMFHNHYRELMLNSTGEVPHVEFQKRTNIDFEIDVYWAYRGGVNPIYMLEQLKDRISVIHVKDGTMEHDAPLGEGTAPIAEVVAWAKKNAVEMVVENEPTAERQMVEAKICIDYLKSLEA
jgi:sugar phosphate isomerase/epimerase